MISIDKTELEALERRMHEIADDLAKKALRKAVRKGMSIVRNDAKQHAPKETGLLKSDFALLTRASDGVMIAKVGIRGGARKNDSTPYYFRFLEFGTKEMPAKPFLRPALEGNAELVLNTIVEELRKALDKS